MKKMIICFKSVSIEFLSYPEDGTLYLAIPGFLDVVPAYFSEANFRCYFDYNYPYTNRFPATWSTWAECLSFVLDKLIRSFSGIRTVTFLADSMGIPISMATSRMLSEQYNLSFEIIGHKIPYVGEMRFRAQEVFAPKLESPEKFQIFHQNLIANNPLVPGNEKLARELFEGALKSNLSEEEIKAFKGKITLLTDHFLDKKLHNKEALDYFVSIRPDVVII
jgi:hypothetical protein